MIEEDNPALLRKMAERLTDSSDPIEDIHYLIVLARLKGARPSSVTRATADALVRLDAKITARKLNRDSNWPLRLAEVHQTLAAKDAALNAAIVGHAEFGRPDHVLWTRCQGFDRRWAAGRCR